MAIRVVMAGAGGRMGSRIIHQIVHSGDLELSGALERESFPELGMDAGQAAGVGALGVPFTSDSKAMEGDVMISFSVPKASLEHAQVASQKGIPIVIGTTGLSDEQRSQLEIIGCKIPCLIAPNMSVGVNVAFRLIEEAARLLGEGYDVEVLEAHHNQKIDAPSGTAVRMGEILARALGKEYPKDAVFHREGETGKRRPGTIGMQTLRGGDVAGEHTVYFFGQGERIEITHRASTRDNFAAGAVRAARWIVGQNPGVYGMTDVLGL